MLPSVQGLGSLAPPAELDSQKGENQREATFPPAIRTLVSIAGFAMWTAHLVKLCSIPEQLSLPQTQFEWEWLPVFFSSLTSQMKASLYPVLFIRDCHVHRVMTQLSVWMWNYDHSTESRADHSELALAASSWCLDLFEHSPNQHLCVW